MYLRSTEQAMSSRRSQSRAQALWDGDVSDSVGALSYDDSLYLIFWCLFALFALKAGKATFYLRSRNA